MERRLIETIETKLREIMFHNFYVSLVTCDMDYMLCGSMPILEALPVLQSI